MDFDNSAIFVKVVQAGSFSEAARVLGMPNSTVSRNVSLLEQRLGVTLLHRTTRKLHVTQAGETYFKTCVQALEQLQAAQSEIATAQQDPQGLLRITATVSVGHNLLPKLVREFVNKYPKVEVEIVVTNDVLDLISEGIDLAIRTGKLKDSGLIARKAVPDHFALWASPSYVKKNGAPSHPKQLTQHECVKSSRFRGNTLELSNGTETANVGISGRVAADDLETVKRFTLSGDGIGLLPNMICSEEAKQGKIIRVLPQWHGASASLFFIYPAHRFVPLKVRAFIDLAGEMLKNGTR
jgi:DNA-binding transcriptional LysR family regulator